MSQTFIKNKEDFVCQKCGFKVSGTGYTNHCPECLHSKHVDIFPGDRAQECRGLMEPIAYDGKDIFFKCLRCGDTRKTKSVQNDNSDILIEISANPIPTSIK